MNDYASVFNPNQGGCCEVITEEASAALRKATKWAQSGLIVSVGPPVESINPETVSGLSTGDKKKTAQTSICRERNSELARWVSRMLPWRCSSRYPAEWFVRRV